MNIYVVLMYWQMSTNKPKPMLTNPLLLTSYVDTTSCLRPGEQHWVCFNSILFLLRKFTDTDTMPWLDAIWILLSWWNLKHILHVTVLSLAWPSLGIHARAKVSRMASMRSSFWVGTRGVPGILWSVVVLVCCRAGLFRRNGAMVSSCPPHSRLLFSCTMTAVQSIPQYCIPCLCSLHCYLKGGATTLPHDVYFAKLWYKYKSQDLGPWGWI